jgi:alpha-tubulin suppressor-like RCC1 family protein
MEPAPTTASTSQEATVSATAALAFLQLSAGFQHTCGVTTDFRAYCWGQNGNGQTGIGTFDNCDFGCPVFYPTPVKGGLSFKQVDAGTNHTCGVTPANRAYCWGYGRLLGTGTTTSRPTPTAVAGARSFRQVSAGGDHSCGVTADDRAYCWGENARGQLGDGTTTFRSAPVAVLGSLHFLEVRAGNSHTCGVTTDNRAFCWGDNQYGEVGDSSTAWKRLKPVRVAGTGQYRRIDAGGQHTCAVTTTDRAFCWGRNTRGALGDGTLSQRRWPKAVAGGLSFNRVTAGGFHTCALTPSNKTYCWGRGGAVGDGTNVDRPKPVAVAGGFSFNQVSAGGAHTCAKTGASAGYCWGSNDWNQLGDGMVIDSYTPSPVTGPAATVALR